MLRLSKKADYALMAMKHLALRTDAGSVSAREIAEQYDIPVELMAKVLQRLARHGLLVSQQGTRGGYLLARAAALISVADVIAAARKQQDIVVATTSPYTLPHLSVDLLGGGARGAAPGGGGRRGGSRGPR